MLRLVSLFLVLVLAGIATAQVTTKERELATVRAEIGRIAAALESKSRKRRALNGELEAAEAELSRARERVAVTANDIKATEARLAEVTQAAQQRALELSAERDYLAGQLRAAYVNGRSERLRLILNQEDPAEVGRRTTYYRYLNTVRQDNISRVNGELAELATLRERILGVRAELTALSERRQRELATTESRVAERAELLDKLNEQIAAEGGSMAELQAREADLEKLIAELNSILSDYPISTERPFADLRGNLTWPVAGRLLNDFGQPRDGSELRWNGVLLGAERGAEVRAIYHGRVAFSEWLPRLGLLVVLDHGDGYLSLYGHNDALVRSVGDWVGAGDVIATVGDSGGQPQPALYIELRQGRKALNPNRWITRKPRQ